MNFFVTTNGFALYHDKNLQIFFFCVKRQAKNDFLKDTESSVDALSYVVVDSLNNNHEIITYSKNPGHSSIKLLIVLILLTSIYCLYWI